MKRQTSASLLLVGALFAHLQSCVRCDEVDMCVSATYIGDPKRSTTYQIQPDEPGICDEQIQSGSWYSFGYWTQFKMPENCVETYRCGSQGPIWLNGSHPTAEEPGPVDREICARKKFDGPCCEYKNKIKVKRCQNATRPEQSYFVYQLVKPPECHLSYCAGRKLDCPVDCAWNEQISNCSCPEFPPMTPPVLEEPLITEVHETIDTRSNPYNATKFTVDCRVGYPMKESDDGARFLVELASNGQRIPFARDVLQFPNDTLILGEEFIHGHLGENITCLVSSFWASDEPKYSKAEVSNTLWFGLRPINEKGEEIKNPVIKDGEVFAFRFQANFPITSPKCFENKDPCFTIYTFRILADKNGRLCTCRFTLSPTKNTTGLITVSPAPIIGSRTKPFHWEIAFDNTTTESETSGTIFEGYRIPSIMVQIEDSGTRPVCTSTGDPHVTTFNRLLYNIYLSGDFSFVNATTRLFQIQVRQFPCTNTVSCNCGVLVREGNNIVGINSCPRGEGDKVDFSPILVRYLQDPDSPSGEIETTGSGWTIMMLSGVKIDVNKGFKEGVLDISVVGLSSDTYDGLCTYSGSQTASCTSECEKYRVSEGDSFFNYNSTNPPKCHEPYVVPTCDCHKGENDGSINVTCSRPNQSNLLKTSYKCAIPLTEEVTEPKPPHNDTDTSCVINPDSVVTTKPNTTGPTVVPVWPTPNNKIDEPKARKACDDALVKSLVYDLCNKQKNMNFTFILEGCVQDIQIADDLSPTRSVERQLQIYCLYIIESAIPITPNGTDPTNPGVKDLGGCLSNICPNQCSERGKCVDSSCKCDSGFIGKDCSLAEGYVPGIKYLVEPVCTLSETQDCAEIYVHTKDELFGYSVSCKIKNPAGTEEFDSSPIVSGAVVICSLSLDVTPGSYSVSISINGGAYSVEVPYTVLAIGQTTSPADKISSSTAPPPVVTTPGKSLCEDEMAKFNVMLQCLNKIWPKALAFDIVSQGSNQCQDMTSLREEFHKCMASDTAKPQDGRK